MRILLVNKFHYLKGGSEKYYFELAEMLKEHGHEIAFFSMKNEKNIKTGEKEYFVEEIDLNSGSKLKALDVIYSKNNKKLMEKVLEEFKPDIVHLNNFQRQLSASIIKPIKKKGIPIVFTAHDLQAVCPNISMLDEGNNICEKCVGRKYSNCVKKKCIKNSKLKSILGAIEGYYYKSKKIYDKKIDSIITPSYFYKEKLVQDGIPQNKIETIHNFIDVNLYDLKTENEEYALYIGRLTKEKGILNLIEAFSKIEGKKLYIAGEGPEKDKVKQYIEDNKLNDKIILLGFLNTEEVKEKIRKCTFVVVPSIWYENCPYSILETLAIGKPIIGANIAGIPELVRDSETGMLFNNTEELYEKMKTLFENKELVETLGKNAKEFARREFSKEQYYNKIYNIYQELLKGVN